MVSFGLGWLWSIFSSFWYWLDRSIFDLIGSLYDILIKVSKVSVLSQGSIQGIYGRIQVFLGVFMLFKVSFSLITYLINPDDFSDHSKGVSKLATNTMVSLVMLAMVPYAFNMAFRLQSLILEDNTLARIIFGEGKSSENGGRGYQYDIMTGGEKMKYEIMMSFFQPNSGLEGLESCATITKIENGVTVFNDSCYKSLRKKGGEVAYSNIENYKLGIETGSFPLTFRLATINTTSSSSDDDYLFEYKWPLTTVAGVITCLLLISFVIDVSIRAIKLSFLQLIAPIPVISYMDPKSGKDGLFGKWLKMTGTTFVSLFVRLLVLYLAIFIISNLDKLVDVVDGSEVTDPIIKVIIIIGVLFFVKQLPQIINNLGINMDGEGKFSLNPFKRMEEGMIGGKLASKLPKAAALGAGGAAVGLGIGAVGTATGAGAGKWFTGMASGLTSGLRGKKIGEIHKDQVAANARMREAIANGSTFRGRMGTRFSGFVGSAGASGKLDAQDKALEDKIKKQQEFHESFDKIGSTLSSAVKGGKLGTYSKMYDRLQAKADAAKQIRDNLDVKDFNGDTAAYNKRLEELSIDAVRAQNKVDKFVNKDLKELYYNQMQGKKLDDKFIENMGYDAEDFAWEEVVGGKTVKYSIKNADVQKGDESDSGVRRAFDEFYQQANTNGWSDTADYQNTKKHDDEVQDYITKLSNERTETRDERERRAADKAATGKS